MNESIRTEPLLKDNIIYKDSTKTDIVRAYFIYIIVTVHYIIVIIY